MKNVSWFVNNETTTQVVLFTQWRRRCLDLVPFSSDSDQTVPTLLAHEPPEITLKKVVSCAMERSLSRNTQFINVRAVH